MWHEARKQERKIRGMLVDYRKRAERRQDFYEKIKADPTQFMQIHGRRCKIHLDPAIAAAGESPAIMMPWQGQHDNLIDRFDVRAHLDYIPPIVKAKDSEETCQEERQCNYESYRILAQNDFLGINEDKYLHQLHLEEQYGVNAQQLEMEKSKKKSNNSSAGGVAIGYTYDSDTNTSEHTSNFNSTNIVNTAAGGAQEDSDSDIDVDVSIDISKIDTQQAHELNGCGRHYGMQSNDFYSFLTKDADEAESLRMAREEEQEKIMLCGRKSRRERRAQREKRFAGRAISPPHYAAKEEPSNVNNDEKNDSDSRSPSPENSGKITYITSFGGEDELTPHSKISINFNNRAVKGISGEYGYSHGLHSTGATGEHISYADKVKQNLDKLKHLNESPKSPRKPLAYQRRKYSRSRSRSRSPYRKRYRRRSSRDSRSLSRRRRQYHRSRSRDRRNRRYSSKRRSSSSSSSSSSQSRRRYRRRRSLSSSSSSSSQNSKASKSSSTSDQRSRSRSINNRTDSHKAKIKVEPKVEPKLPQAIETPPTQVTMPTIIAPVVTMTHSPAVVQQIQQPEPMIKEEPKMPEIQVPVKKYYGRKRDNQSSSDEEYSLDEVDSTDKTNSEAVKNSHAGKAATTHTKASSSSLSSSTSKSTLNPRDRLKKKMQILLNKQYKADKLAEIEKNERQIQQQQERDDEMREMALRLRRRQRELRHKYGSPSGVQSQSDDSNSGDDNRSVEDNRKTESHRSSRNRSSSVERHRRRRSRSVERHRPSYRRSRSRNRSSYRRSSRDSSRHRRNSRERNHRRSRDRRRS